jgi:hypothetical protein
MANWTQADLDALRAALAERGKNGFPSDLTFGDRSVRFGTLADALKLLAVMERAVNPGTTPSSRLAATSKGC